MTDKASSKKLPIVIVLCVTLVLISVVGGWVYAQKQQIAQKDRALQQEKQLKEYEQQQINDRNERDNYTKRINNNSSNPYTRTGY